MRLRIKELKKQANASRERGTPKLTNVTIGAYVYPGNQSANSKAVRVQRQNTGESKGILLIHLFRYMQIFNCTANELIEFKN